MAISGKETTSHQEDTRVVTRCCRSRWYDTVELEFLLGLMYKRNPDLKPQIAIADTPMTPTSPVLVWVAHEQSLSGWIGDRRYKFCRDVLVLPIFWEALFGAMFRNSRAIHAKYAGEEVLESN